MTDARTADARLERLLHILPAAMREGGVALSALAEALGAPEKRIFEDLEELTARAFYQPGGWADDVQILVDEGRVRVFRAAGFERPMALTRDEAISLALALRGNAATTHALDPATRAALLARVEAHLCVTALDDEAQHTAVPTDPSFEAASADPDPERIRDTMIAAARERRPCGIWYVKSGASDGSVRVVHPYAIAHGEGSWYAVAHCATEGDVRVFRLDRILAADFAEGSFAVPDDFDVANYLNGGRVYYASTPREARVRYSPRIARWVRERAQWAPERVEEMPDGSLVVRHEVADSSWVLSHTLQYGADAEIVEPAELRAVVREALTELVTPS